MERWSSRLGFLLAAISSAVGLGNIWRFSAVVGQNGGGAYLLPYFLAIFIFAIPLLAVELSIGRTLRTDVVSSFKAVHNRFAIVGWVLVVVVFLILGYYLVLTGWVFAFFLASFSETGVTFGEFTGSLAPVGFFVFVSLLVGGIVGFGVRRGIERLARLVMPIIFVILIFLVAYATTLSGFSEGISFFLQPNFDVLRDPLLWSAAFGQVFFSIGVGQGIMLTYGSYVDDQTNLMHSSVVIAVADSVIALLAGLAIFPIVFTFGLEPAAGTELAFVTLPHAFAQMPFGSIVAGAFFGMLFLAAVSSAVSMFEVGVAALSHQTGISRPHAAGTLTVGAVLVGLPAALSYSAVRLSIGGQPILDLMDSTVGTLGLPVTATLLIVAFLWISTLDDVRADITAPFAYAVTKYVTPAVLIIVTGVTVVTGIAIPMWGYLPNSRTVDVVFLGMLLAIVLPAIAFLQSLIRLRGKDR